MLCGAPGADHSGGARWAWQSMTRGRLVMPAPESPLVEVVVPDLPGDAPAPVVPCGRLDLADLLGRVGARLAQEGGEELVPAVFLEVERGDEGGLHALPHSDRPLAPDH